MERAADTQSPAEEGDHDIGVGTPDAGSEFTASAFLTPSQSVAPSTSVGFKSQYEGSDPQIVSIPRICRYR
jgi:hypothetical protein